jgi:hypothetical protein
LIERRSRMLFMHGKFFEVSGPPKPASMLGWVANFCEFAILVCHATEFGCSSHHATMRERQAGRVD